MDIIRITSGLEHARTNRHTFAPHTHADTLGPKDFIAPVCVDSTLSVRAVACIYSMFEYTRITRQQAADSHPAVADNYRHIIHLCVSVYTNFCVCTL